MAAYLEVARINGGAKASQTPLNAARHNLRCIAAELQGRPGDRIDPARIHLNQVLYGPATPEEIIALMNQFILDQRAEVWRKDLIQMFEVVIDPKQALLRADEDRFFKAAMTWLESWLDCPMLSAIVHRDETSPHAHVLFVPLRNGRLQGSMVIGNKHKLARMQKRFYDEVCKPFGLSKPATFSREEKAPLADSIVKHVTRAGVLSADVLHQLRVMVRNAPNLAALANACGLAGVHEPALVEVAFGEPESATSIFSVGVQPAMRGKAMRHITPPVTLQLSPKRPGIRSTGLHAPTLRQAEIASGIPPP
ncbi:hypothetical protein HNQ50_000307 [Silvimonas terrae]|uniref:Plasmid recombination enzyme n=1 Tax=Silvimonas terrae TaxID=300266 RepID=A0A840R9L5_9NEIS|nr:plasmid recombination protein [Silvimonas terrae]MBB5189597.1 hypothetical protein [Silvimonas terrae]